MPHQASVTTTMMMECRHCTPVTNILLALSLCLIVPMPLVAGRRARVANDHPGASSTTAVLHEGWTACQWQHLEDFYYGCPEEHLLTVKTLPTTALAVLLDNQQIPELEEYNITMDNLYHSRNLAMIPDISEVGRDYYTLAYQLYLDDNPDDNHQNHNNPIINTYENAQMSRSSLSTSTQQTTITHRILHLEGANYRVYAYLNGKPLLELESKLAATDGMFRRRSYDVSQGGRLILLIEPPLHPGRQDDVDYKAGTTTVTQRRDKLHLQQQGGNHHLAMDGATAQFMLGWDWCQPMPDRATGFFGVTSLQTILTSTAKVPATITAETRRTNEDDAVSLHPTVALIRDPAIHTKKVIANDDCLDDSATATNPRDTLSNCSRVLLSIMARIQRIHAGDDKNLTLSVQSDWDEHWVISSVPLKQDGTASDVRMEVEVQHPENVQLWWPVGVGVTPVAHLHSFTFTLHDGSALLNNVTIPVGIRSIETYLDKKLQGQVFVVNGHRLYLTGGNWISPDQALRYSASSERYCNELALHTDAGFNLIRVWGGGMAERDAFYNCADYLGLLVFQEFWMTGDNNGRWAGSYEWPLDYGSYLANVEDTVKRLRGHASLLFYGGCNECLAPRNDSHFPNPPREIDDGIRNILNQFHPDIFYISSSMGGKNKADSFQDPTLWWNRSFSLAWADGPYGMLLPQTLFERNPGLGSLVPSSVNIGFQPEIGSASAPTYKGLLRFMTKEEADTGRPERNETSAGPTWEYHKFLPWLSKIDNSTVYDHVYAYFGPKHEPSASDWCAAAQLAAYAQYQNLMNGFISHAFNYTTAVILWKSQTPWPALRGFLYDWYLESTGTFYGIRAALNNPVSVTLETTSWKLRVINRSIHPLQPTTSNPVGANYAFFNLQGKIVESGNLYISASTTVAPMTASMLDGTLTWPEKCPSVCFLWLELIAKNEDFTSWQWLTDPSLGDLANYNELGDMRMRQMGHALLFADECVVDSSSTTVSIRIELSSQATDILFYPTLSMSSKGQDLFPLFDSGDVDLVLLPGYAQVREIKTPVPVAKGSEILISLDSWNGPATHATISCHVSDV